MANADLILSQKRIYVLFLSIGIDGYNRILCIAIKIKVTNATLGKVSLDIILLIKIAFRKGIKRVQVFPFTIKPHPNNITGFLSGLIGVYR